MDNNEQITDIAQKIQDALRAYGQVNVTVIKYVPMPIDGPPRKVPGLPGLPPQVPAMPVHFVTKQYLTASNIRTLKVTDIIWGEDNIVSMPDAVIEKSQVCENYSDVQSTQQQTLSISFSRTSTIAIQKTVQNTTTESVNFKVSIVPKVFDVSGTLQISNTTTIATTNTNSNQVTVTSSSTESVTLQPHSAVLLTIRQWTLQHQIQFTCQVIIEADLSTNDAGYSLLSQVLNEPQRTFTIQGILYANDCSNAETTQSNAPLPPVQNINFINN